MHRVSSDLQVIRRRLGLNVGWVTALKNTRCHCMKWKTEEGERREEGEGERQEEGEGESRRRQEVGGRRGPTYRFKFFNNMNHIYMVGFNEHKRG